MEPLQLPLLSSADMPDAIFLAQEEHPRAVCTGERFRARRPEDYARCLALLREGESVKLICDVLGVEHRTVAAVAAAHAIPIGQAKTRMAERCHFTARMAFEAADRALAAGDAQEAKNAAIAGGIAVEKWQLLGGEPTSRVEMEVVAPEHDDFNAWIGSGGGEVRAKSAAGPERAAIDVETVPPSLPPTASASQADAGGCATTGCEQDEGGCIPGMAPATPEPGQDYLVPEAERGGGGSRPKSG